jgi:hypothetical protein
VYWGEEAVKIVGSMARNELDTAAVSRNLLCCVFISLLVLTIFPNRAKAQDQSHQVIVPAGTLLRCTLDEPKFSSKTADVGDPVVCYLSAVRLFDRTVFPRGAYLGGHLEADKDPGRFFGKGYLKLAFDHIGLPNDQVPVPAKIIAAHGFRVDKEGKIIGHGHATRDTLEWMIPPLWPEKVLTVPRRGPRPTLKGEEPLTLRLMDDVAIPTEPLSEWPHLGSSSSANWRRWNEPAPSRNYAPQVPASARPRTTSDLRVAAEVMPASSPGTSADSAKQSVLVLRNGTTSLATSLSVDGDRLSYTQADGTHCAVSLEDVDWAKTFQRNSENRAMLALTSRRDE